jgi:hypothetical protein
MHVLVGGLVALLAAPAAASESGWSVARAETDLAGATGIRETRWQAPRPPGGTYDRVQLHRYRGRVPRIAALLYLPGTNMNAEAAVLDEAHNLWLFLAGRGVDVYALDYRTHFVPAAGAADFGFMRGWGIEAFVDDARAAAELARRESGVSKLFVAGFSRGVTLAYALAATDTTDGIAGIIALDGAFKSHAPAARFDRAEALARIESTGAWASDVAGRLGWETRQRLMEAAAANPAGSALDPRFKSVGEQVSDVLYNAWRPGGLANPVEGMSRPEVLARLLAGYDRYYPAVQDPEGRSIADRPDDPATALDDRWGKLSPPVLYFGSTGMGPEWLMNGIASAAGAGSKDVTINVLERYGHLDVVVGENARHDVFEPTLAWIRKRVQ